jgi:L-fuconolactonase
VTVVDAHHHFWDPARADYPWLTDELEAIRRKFGPDDLRPLLAERGVDATVLVQTRSSLDETREFLAIADRTDFVAGVVGWVDLTDPSVGETIEELRAGPGGGYLAGIRHQVHDEPDPAWLRRPDVERGLGAVESAGLAYDLLVRTRELPAAVETAQTFPGLAFVLDHLAKPPIREGKLQPWLDRIRPLGALPNVSCKLSGMVTEADWTGWRREQFRPFVDAVVAIFGPGRLLFGSDWPVCLLAGSYRTVFDLASETLSDLGEAERAAVFGGNAARVYRLAAAS